MVSVIVTPLATQRESMKTRLSEYSRVLAKNPFESDIDRFTPFSMPFSGLLEAIRLQKYRGFELIGHHPTPTPNIMKMGIQPTSDFYA